MSSFLISGARSGIGLEYVRQLARHSENTIVALVRDITANLQSVEAIVQSAEGRVLIVEYDLSSTESIISFPTRLPHGLTFDTVIQNAAILLPASHEESTINMTPSSLKAHFEINVIGPALLFQTLVPFLVLGAVVANITSGVGSMSMLSRGQIPAQIPAYSMSKAALNMPTVHQAHELKEKAIVVCVDPGHVKTQMGGPGAVMEVVDRAKSVIGTLERLEEKDSGC